MDDIVYYNLVIAEANSMIDFFEKMIREDYDSIQNINTVMESYKHYIARKIEAEIELGIAEKQLDKPFWKKVFQK